MKVKAVVVRPADPAILVLPSGLPEVEFGKDSFYADVERPLEAFQEQLGIEAYVLTLLDGPPDETTYLMLSTGAVPAEARWVHDHPAAEAARRHLDLPRGAPVTPAWTKPDWYVKALPWIDEHLPSPRTGRPVQVRNWGLSNVLRVPTETGAVYFKAVGHSSTITPIRPDAYPLLFVHEPHFMATLSADRPGAVAAPLAIDEKRGWMLMADLGTPLAGQTEIDVWLDAIRSHAVLQRSYVDRPERLFEAGCVDRRLTVLESAIDDLLGQNPATEQLEPELRVQLPQRADELRAAIVELAAIGVPETLLHGDLHPGNVAIRDGVALSFDWTDAAIGHPFLDLVTFAQDKLPISQDPRLTDAYLAEWSEYASPAGLRRALSLAEELGALHQVMTSLYLADHLHAHRGGNMINGAVWWLKKILKQ
ncbi:phosphotransferase family protein [Kribbella sp. NPDC020789]